MITIIINFVFGFFLFFFTKIGVSLFVQALINGKRPCEPSERDSEFKYLTSGPVLALCLQRVNAVKRLLELLGPEDPAQARTEDLHVWRASYGTDRLRNGIYGSRTSTLFLQKLFECNCSDDYLVVAVSMRIYLFTLFGLSPCQSYITCRCVSDVYIYIKDVYMNLGNINVAVNNVRILLGLFQGDE